jgi:hypothetical protein
MYYMYDCCLNYRCVTFIWDDQLSLYVELLPACSSHADIPACNAYNYEAHYEGEY